MIASSNSGSNHGPVLLRSNMDTGHYNCRDYYISSSPSSSSPFPPALASDRSDSLLHAPPPRTPFVRHESFDELEQRARSPASSRPKFPLLKLPLELRQQIFSYLLPYTKELKRTNPLASHARNFSAVQKRCARGLILPALQSSESDGCAPSCESLNGSSAANPKPSNIVWQRGNVHLLSVNRQLHAECADALYGDNTFLLFVTYGGTNFRYQYLLPSGMTPNRRLDFLALLPPHYVARVRKAVVHVDHVDSYTGMIKFNVGGAGLTHGLRGQVQKLVNALGRVDGRGGQGEDEAGLEERLCAESGCGRRLARLHVNVSNGNAVTDAIKRVPGPGKISEDLEEMLAPFMQLRGVREVVVTGSITDGFARHLERTMRSLPDDAQ